MSRCYVQLGKLGDVLNILPLLLEDRINGHKPSLLVCKEYASILDGCSYVNPAIFDGELFQIASAIGEARKLSDDIKVCQVLGPRREVLEHVYKLQGVNQTVTDSFQQESWRLAGRKQSDWERQLPLVFDKRDTEIEAALIAKHIAKRKRTLLVNFKGLSSPFPFADLIAELVRLKLSKEFKIVDLSEIQSEHFYDLLGLYENAHAMISVDTSTLHLAHACPKLPVIALTKDTPNYWHGSAWRPQHVCYMRYGDFPSHWRELFEAVEEL